jgi:hypothetical protein
MENVCFVLLHILPIQKAGLESLNLTNTEQTTHNK